jgi:hypothetical protein
MRQYWKIKDRHPGAILLFRMGDFYETFEEDAKIVADVLGITLTKRGNGAADGHPAGRVPAPRPRPAPPEARPGRATASPSASSSRTRSSRARS